MLAPSCSQVAYHSHATWVHGAMEPWSRVSFWGRLAGWQGWWVDQRAWTAVHFQRREDSLT